MSRVSQGTSNQVSFLWAPKPVTKQSLVHRKIQKMFPLLWYYGTIFHRHHCWFLWSRQVNMFQFSLKSVLLTPIDKKQGIAQSMAWRKTTAFCCIKYCVSHRRSFDSFLTHWRNGHNFADDPFKRILLNETFRSAFKISLTFAPKGPVNNIEAFVQIMAWCRPGDKPLSEPMIMSLLTHVCVHWPQCVNDMCIMCNMCNPFIIHSYCSRCQANKCDIT